MKTKTTNTKQTKKNEKQSTQRVISTLANSMEDHANQVLKQIMSTARETGKTVETILPASFGQGTTTWTATPNEHGGVELTYKINK